MSTNPFCPKRRIAPPNWFLDQVFDHPRLPQMVRRAFETLAWRIEEMIDVRYK